jgi:hypothetical protein
MRSFLVKDLMCAVMPKPEGQVPGYQPCAWDSKPMEFCWTPHSCWWFRSCVWIVSDPCRAYHSDLCRLIQTGLMCELGSKIPEIDPRIPVTNPVELGILRENLKETLKNVEAAEKRVAEKMAPQTMGEVEMLRGKFHEALEELDAIAEKMGKG